MPKIINKMPIDPDRFRDQINKNDLNLYTASRAIGYSNSFLGNSLRREPYFFTVSTILLIEKVLGIKYEDYAPLEEKAEKDMPESIQDELKSFLMQLLNEQRLISDAAVSMCGKVDRLLNELEEVICRGTSKALEGEK